MEKQEETFRLTLAIRGCDDRTNIGLELTQSELDFVTKLCQLSKQESTFSCQPTLAIEPIERCWECPECHDLIQEDWCCYACGGLEKPATVEIKDKLTTLKVKVKA